MEEDRARRPGDGRGRCGGVPKKPGKGRPAVPPPWPPGQVTVRCHKKLGHVAGTAPPCPGQHEEARCLTGLAIWLVEHVHLRFSEHLL